jgi:hypothetical protein
MKIRDVIQEFIPCEVCGNREIQKFYFHVFVHKGSQPYVKCCECEEEYYSTKAREIISKVEDSRKERAPSSQIIPDTGYGNLKKQEYIHPLLKVLSGF